MKGRKLETEQILFGDHMASQAGERADFSQATTVNPPISPVHLENW